MFVMSRYLGAYQMLRVLIVDANKQREGKISIGEATWLLP